MHSWPWWCCCGGGGTGGTGVTVCPSPVTDAATNFTTPVVSLTWRALSRYEVTDGGGESCWLNCDGGAHVPCGVGTTDHGAGGLVPCEIVAWRDLALYDSCECFGPYIERTAVQPVTGTAQFEIWCQAGTPPGGAGWYTVTVISLGGTSTGYARNLSDTSPAPWTMRLVSYGRCMADLCGSRYLYSGFLVRLTGQTSYDVDYSLLLAGCADHEQVETVLVGGLVDGWFARALAAGDTVGCMPAGTYGLRRLCESTCSPVLVNCPFDAGSGCCGGPMGSETLCECY